jgi:hypothetical protein
MGDLLENIYWQQRLTRHHSLIGRVRPNPAVPIAIGIFRALRIYQRAELFGEC